MLIPADILNKGIKLILKQPIPNLGAVELKTDVKKIRVRGDRFTAQKNIYGDFKNQPDEQNAKISSLYDLADILATSKYDQSATAKEPSYANPNIPPKNAAHKNVKYWYKFRNEIVFDGVPYTVTFNIRDKGGEQYQYLIEFKENKTPGLSNTAVKNLLRTDQVSYETILPNLGEDVKAQFSISPVAGQQTGQQTGEQQTGEQTQEDPAEAAERKGLTPKAKGYLEGKEREFLRDLGDKLYVPRIARREWLKPIVH